MPYTAVPYATHLPVALDLLRDPGLLLVAAGRDGRPNAMTIGWGTVGIIWGKPIFSVLVRPSRHTFRLLEESDSFTVCAPAPSQYDAVEFCGTRSGRDMDKFAACGLTARPSSAVRAPGIEGCPLIYECQVVHTNDVVPAHLTEGIRASAYPQGDYHRLYYGEILALQALDDAARRLEG
ncbi:MAG: flavin reductase family protein [Chloroflexi bacterium]|nr:flavin reductase family protein [Chloroflexota bacterium]